jgi:hypothetical protein
VLKPVFLNPKAHQNGGEQVLSKRRNEDEMEKGQFKKQEKGGPCVRELIEEGKKHKEE